MRRSQRSDPQPNTQDAKILEGSVADTDPSDASGSEIQSGIAAELAVTKSGDSNSPVKMEMDAAEASPLQMTLIAALQSTISSAHSVAQSNGDSARALIADMVDQIAKIQASFTTGESAVERKLRELREAAAGDADEDEDDEDEKPSDAGKPEDEDEDEDESRGQEDPVVGGESPLEEHSKDEDDDEDEKRSWSVNEALAEIRREKGIPEIRSVSEGLAYLRQGR